MTTTRRNALSVQEALELGEGSIHIWGGQKFKSYIRYHLITVCNEAYYSKCENTNAWYETDFIPSFAALIAHWFHSICSLSVTDGKSRILNSPITHGSLAGYL